MDHTDHVNLLRAGVTAGGTWADFGSGTGAFTLALADRLGPTGVIYSIERDEAALAAQKRSAHERFPDAIIHYLQADYTRPIDLPPLDGLVAANTLHFHRTPEPIVSQLCAYLKPGGRLIVVEYNVTTGNSAVPYPIPFPRWAQLAAACGLTHTRLLARRPSHFLREIYAAMSEAPAAGT